MFLNCGTSLLVVIRMIAFKLQSVNIDLFLDLFIFIQGNARSQIYVDPNSDKSLATKFFRCGNALKFWSHKTALISLHSNQIVGIKFQKYSENTKL